MKNKRRAFRKEKGDELPISNFCNRLGLGLKFVRLHGGEATPALASPLIVRLSMLIVSTVGAAFHLAGMLTSGDVLPNLSVMFIVVIFILPPITVPCSAFFLALGLGQRRSKHGARGLKPPYHNNIMKI